MKKLMAPWNRMTRTRQFFYLLLLSIPLLIPIENVFQWPRSMRILLGVENIFFFLLLGYEVYRFVFLKKI